ncbi:hypothetical protein [Kribbella sp. NPDC006257]|uniref:hypothetical protein n=1 Tax=Kribbella sp. NPDC006257 TaxID=3156738 RepID=UPI0033B9A16C
MSACRRTRFGQTGDRDDLDWAVAASRQAVELTSDGDSSVCGRLTNLAVCLLSVYETTAHAASLDEAVRVGRRAVEQTNSGPVPLATAATNLGNVLLTRFELRSAPYDLDDSVAAARRAVELTPADSPFRVARLSNLANVLREKAFRGVEGAADESVKAAELAVGAAEPGDPMLPGFWSNLGLALSTRCDVHARGEDLDRSIEAFREAVRTAEGSEQDALMYRSNLGMALRQRGVANDSPADLDEAIAVLEAVTAADWGGHPDSAPFLWGWGTRTPAGSIGPRIRPIWRRRCRPGAGQPRSLDPAPRSSCRPHNRWAIPPWRTVTGLRRRPATAPRSSC